MYNNRDNESSCSSEDSNPWLTECLKQCTDINDCQTHCNICNWTMNKTQFMGHVEGQSHKNNMDKLLKDHQLESTDADAEYVYYCELCDSYTNDFMAHIKFNIDHENWKWIYGGVDKSKLKYYVYDTDVQNAEANNYRATYKEMLIRNYIRTLNDTHFFCEPCQLKLSRTTEIYHMFGKRHTTGLEEYQQSRKI